MLLLALDTSTRQASISLCSEDEVYSEYTWSAANNHSIELLANIQRIFAECHKALSQLDVVAVATGPGSFNGVRVALATAKALAFALKKPLVGVGTLDIIAAQQHHVSGPICALLEAGRSELYAAWYLSDEQPGILSEMTCLPRRVSDYLLETPHPLIAMMQEHASAWFGASTTKAERILFTGEISAKSRQALHAALPEEGLFVHPVSATRRASLLALMAAQRLREGKEDDPRLLEPLYIRRPSITTSTRKQSLLGGTTPLPAGQPMTEREEGALRH